MKMIPGQYLHARHSSGQAYSFLVSVITLLVFSCSAVDGRNDSIPLNEEIEVARGFALKAGNIVRNMTAEAKCESRMRY